MNTHTTTPDADTAASTLDRRRLIAAALAGGALTVPFARSVAANDTTTTTAPPRRDAGDLAVLNGALALERDLVATYLAVHTRGGLGDDEGAVVLAVHDNHKAYVDALVGYMGPEATPDRERTATAPSGDFESVAGQLAAAEGRAVASHLAAVGAVRGVEAAALLASIITVEARHQSAMAILAGQPASNATA